MTTMLFDLLPADHRQKVVIAVHAANMDCDRRDGPNRLGVLRGWCDLLAVVGGEPEDDHVRGEPSEPGGRQQRDLSRRKASGQGKAVMRVKERQRRGKGNAVERSWKGSGRQ